MKRIILFLILISASLYGQQWELTSSEPSFIGSYLVTRNGDIYAGGARVGESGEKGELYKFLGSGDEWARLNPLNEFDWFLIENERGELLHIDKSKRGVSISADGGNTWSYVPDSVDVPVYAYGDTLISKSGMLSKDGGHIWEKININLSYGDQFFAVNSGVYFAEKGVDESYSYYKVSLSDYSLTNIGNYAHKRPYSFYTMEYLNYLTLPDSIKINVAPFYEDGSIQRFQVSEDRDGNLILYNGSGRIYGLLNNKWQLLNYDGLGDILLSGNYIINYSGLYRVNYDSTFALDTLLNYNGISTNPLYQKEYGVNNDTTGIYFLNEGKELLKYDLITKEVMVYKKGIAGQSILGMSNANNKIYAYDISGGIYVSENNGFNWTKLQNAPKISGKNYFFATDSLLIGVSGLGGYTQYSKDGGNIWDSFYPVFRASYLYSDGSTYFAWIDDPGSRHIKISTDNGASWNKYMDAAEGVSSILIDNDKYLISTFTNSVLFINGSIVDTTSAPEIVRSLTLSNGLFFGGTDAGIVKLDKNELSGNRIFKTSANPEWTFTGLEGKKILSLTSDSLGVVYAGTEDGTYFSADSGATWEVYGTVISGNLKKTSSTGLSQVKALLVNGSELFAAASEGLYKTKTYNAIGINEEPNITVTGFKLAQNYPNPFNPETNISFSLPKAAHVKLTVYNMLGQEVGQLVNMELGQGSYNYKFDGRKLSSGVYIYSLEAGQFRTAKKMMLIK